MHTVLVLAGGFVLLFACLLIGRLAGGSAAAMVTGAYAFFPLWLIGGAINMWFGVAKAGYSVKDELPVFLVVFAVPAAAALVFVWQFKTH